MVKEFEPDEIKNWRANLTQGRTLVDATTVPMLYFTPAEMEENSDPSIEAVNFENVWAGLQQYQAQINEIEGSAPSDTKVKILGEIFSEPNDLISLARTVDLQIGTNDVALSLLKTHPWVTWEIAPQAGDVTEGNFIFKHITLSLTVNDTSLKAISKRNVILDEDEEQLIEQQSLIVYSDPRDGGNYEIDFDLISTDVSEDGSNIILNGVVGTREEPEDRLLPYVAYKFMRNGRMETGEGSGFTTKTDILKGMEKDDGLPLILNREDLQELGLYKPVDWTSMRELLTTDDEARRALLKFLLPYCDMPTEGIRYVLSEVHAKEMIDRLGEERPEISSEGYVRL